MLTAVGCERYSIFRESLFSSACIVFAIMEVGAIRVDAFPQWRNRAIQPVGRCVPVDSRDVACCAKPGRRYRSVDALSLRKSVPRIRQSLPEKTAEFPRET